MAIEAETCSNRQNTLEQAHSHLPFYTNQTLRKLKRNLVTKTNERIEINTTESGNFYEYGKMKRFWGLSRQARWTITSLDKSPEMENLRIGEQSCLDLGEFCIFWTKN